MAIEIESYWEGADQRQFGNDRDIRCTFFHGTAENNSEALASELMSTAGVASAATYPLVKEANK